MHASSPTWPASRPIPSLWGIGLAEARGVGIQLAPRLQAERRRLFRQRISLVAVLALVLVPLFAVLDYEMYRLQFRPLLAARLGSVIVTATVIIGLRTRFGKRAVAWLALLLAVEAMVAVAAIPILLTGIVNMPHYVSAALLLLSAAALLPWTEREAIGLAGALAVIFLVAAILHGNLPIIIFAMQLSTLLVTGAISVLIVTLNERAREREFVARRGLRAVVRERSRLIADLQEKRADLERLNQEMEDILYVASHDLRAPLINMQGFATELKGGVDQLVHYVNGVPAAAAIRSDIDESLRFISSATQRMDGLVGGLLNVSRIATRTAPIEEVDLLAVVETVVESFRYQLSQRGITAVIGDLPTVRGDAVRLNQVFSNLIDNAIKYMGDGAMREIEVGTHRRGGHPVLFVRDTGPGIPPASHEAVFRLFRRLDSGVPGEGLGLTMVRKIIEKHGGHIWVESTPGQGSTFCFTLWHRPAYR